MASEMKWKFNSLPKSNGDSEAIFDLESMKAALSFHQSFPGYSPTPLVNLKEMSTHLGLGSLHVKDESYRFGLSAFKALGSSFATARLISTLLDMPLSNLTYDVLTSPEAKERLSSATLVTATDGNHGRGVAWTASQLGIKAIVLMPAGTTRTRFDNIEAEGAKVTIERLSYDECVQKASRIAASIDGAILMQDTAWPGYETIPSYIMQGYSTMVAETFSQLEQEQSPAPTHVFLQAGVGSMAGAVAEYVAKLLPNAAPKIAIVEPFAADCHYLSACVGDGFPHPVSGEGKTLMAGLNCGTPNPISWDILRDRATVFLSMDDSVTKRGMRMLASPLGSDRAIISGESGAAGMGALAAIMLDEELGELRDGLGLDEKSHVLIISTEGDTDPKRYRKIIADA